MPVFVRGFKQTIAARRDSGEIKRSRQDFSASLADFQSKLESLHSESDEDDEDPSPRMNVDLSERPRATTYSRRVLIPTNQRLQVERVVALNAIYNAETKALDKVQRYGFMEHAAGDGTRFRTAVFNREESADMFRVVYEKMLSTADRVTQLNDLTTNPGMRRFTNSIAHQDAEMILEDFYRICQLPNDAEVRMLSVACSEQSSVIKTWFISKRKVNSRLFHAMDVLDDKEQDEDISASGLHECWEQGTQAGDWEIDST